MTANWNAGFVISCFLISYVATIELITEVQSRNYRKPFFFRFCNGFAQMLLLIPSLFFRSSQLEESDVPGHRSLISRLMMPSIVLGLCSAISGATLYIALQHTIPALGFTLLLSECAWIYILNVIRGRDSIGMFKILGLVLCLVGVLCLGMSSRSGESDNDLTGVILLIITTMCYVFADYFMGYVAETRIKDKILDTTFLQGFVGLWQNLILLPVLFVLDAEGWETFELPPRRILGLYFLTLGIDVVSQVTNRLSVVYGGPFIFSLCLLFTSPLGFAVDALFRETHFSSLDIMGTSLLLLGFILIKLQEEKKETEETNTGYHHIQV